MKFFTLDAYDAWDEDGILLAAAAAYDRHLAALRGTVPDELLALAALPGVDDGLIVEVHHVRSLETLQLILRGGDLQVGYYDLVLQYEGVLLSPQTEWTLAKIARNEHDLAYHEVDRTESGGVEHRLLFHPGLVLHIGCRQVQWQKVDRPDRRLPALPDRFPGGPFKAPHRTRTRRFRAEPSRL